jgi:hypothetical protein
LRNVASSTDVTVSRTTDVTVTSVTGPTDVTVANVVPPNASPVGSEAADGIDTALEVSLAVDSSEVASHSCDDVSSRACDDVSSWVQLVRGCSPNGTSVTRPEIAPGIDEGVFAIRDGGSVPSRACTSDDGARSQEAVSPTMEARACMSLQAEGFGVTFSMEDSERAAMPSTVRTTAS